jgi:hypothetical protein
VTDQQTAIPTLTTTDEAHALLRELADSHDWVSVFWDRGWADSGQTAEVSIIVDGNGQEPKAFITADVYEALTAARVVEPDSLKTYKARRLHDYETPPVPEKASPDANDVAEQVIRDLMRAHPDWPIRAEFYRGLDPNSHTPRVTHEIVENAPQKDGRRVLMLPGAFEVAISAQERGILGYNISGGGWAQVLAYPRNGDEVDLDALQGDLFRAELVAVVEAKLADIEAARTKG